MFGYSEDNPAETQKGNLKVSDILWERFIMVKICFFARIEQVLLPQDDAGCTQTDDKK